MRAWLIRHRATILHWSMEIVVVMLGVLLALAVQQWAEGRAARQRAADAEDRIRQELLGNAQFLIERVATRPCLVQRLTALKDGLMRGGPNWRPAQLPSNAQGDRVFARVYGVPVRPFSSDVFRSVGNSGATTAVAPERVGELSQTYSMITSIADLNRDEQRLAVKLIPLQLIGPGDLRDRSDMLADLATLDADNGLMSVVARQAVSSMVALGYRFTAAEARDAALNFRYELLAGGQKIYGSCFDIGSADALFRQLLPTRVR